MEEINERMAGIGIEDEENEELVFDEEVEEGVNKFELCLVGRFLTEKNINSRAMKSKLADIWKPARGISIKELKTGFFLFQFYHADDMKWVINGGPWSFDGTMLIINTVSKGEDPMEVPLIHISFWIQVYGLPGNLMSEQVGKQLGDFFGKFVSYDPNNNSSIWRECMRIKILVDVRKPLKRKKKICRKNGAECIVQCKYERLGEFCFVCGMVTHTERFCNKKLSIGSTELVRKWGIWLRAPPRKAAGQERSRWLRDERDVDWGTNSGSANYSQSFSENVTAYRMWEVNLGRNFRGKAHVLDNSQLIDSSKKLAANFNSSSSIGPDKEELLGLNLEERKRRRGLNENEYMETEGGNVALITESNLSRIDCTDSSPEFLAKLARQASQQK